MDAELTTPILPERRRSFLAPLWANARIQGYWSILQIRDGGLIFGLTALVEMLLARQLWIALFNGRAVYEGYTLDQTLTYVVLSMAILPLFRGDAYLYWQIRTGNILNQLIYPLRWTTGLIAFALASVFGQLITNAIPLLLMAAFLLKIPMPSSLTAWLAFAVSFLIGILIYNCIDILTNMLGFWTTELSGVVAWKDILLGILSGAALPLWIFPDAVEQVIAWLPFRCMQYVPLSILVGWIGPDQYLREMAIQLFWLAVLWLSVEGLYELARRKIEIQGG
jgi:ABC-2 type transport system permease protein